MFAHLWHIDEGLFGPRHMQLHCCLKIWALVCFCSNPHLLSPAEVTAQWWLGRCACTACNLSRHFVTFWPKILIVLAVAACSVGIANRCTSGDHLPKMIGTKHLFSFFLFQGACYISHGKINLQNSLTNKAIATKSFQFIKVERKDFFFLLKIT